MPFSALPSRVRARLSEEELGKLGSVGWHATTVKLELEARGEISRVAGVTPQQLKLGSQE